MSGLSPDAKSLIAECRGQAGPSAEDRARLRSKLAPGWAAFERQQLAAAASVSRSTSTTSTTSTWWSATATRWLLCVSLVWWAGQPAPRRYVEQQAHVATPNAAQLVAADAARAAELESAKAAAAELAPALQPTATAEPAPALQPTADVPVPPSERKRLRASRTPVQLKAALASERAAQAARSAPAPAERSAEASEAAQPTAASDAVQRGKTLAPGPVRAQNAVERERVEVLERHEHTVPKQGDPELAPQPIGDELELLGVAQDALRKQQPSVALRLVQQHAFRFPRGALRRERQAVQTLALCALKRFGPARTVFDDLEQNAPESPVLESVRRACGF